MLWSDDEREHLQRLSPRHSVKEIAKRLGRSFASIRSAIERQRCGRPKLDTWTAAETDLLRIDWPNYSAGVIAKRLGRSRNAVVGKVHRMRRDGVEFRVVRIKYRLPQPKPIARQPKEKPNLMPPPKSQATIQCPCHLVELGPLNCKWPYGDPLVDGFYFCGAQVLDGSPYCRDHRLLAYQVMNHARSRSGVA
jgi:GcrA cell cycle regulator